MDDRDQRPPADDSEPIEDLDVSEKESADVKGGALNAYFESVTGEKQGKFKGGVIQKG